jgi:hypothetical protein
VPDEVCGQPLGLRRLPCARPPPTHVFEDHDVPGAEIVLADHDHVDERFGSQDIQGRSGV